MTADELIERIEDLGLRPYAYSGRGMHGEQCVAVDIRRLEYADGLPLKGCTSDSMGLGMVIYWPKIKAPQSLIDRDLEDDEDDEDDDR